MKKELVNFEILGEAMATIDEALESYNQVEKDLILKQYMEKRKEQGMKQKQHDMLGQLDFKGILSKVMKGGKEE